MKYEILYDTPLVPGSIITFNIGHATYIGKVTLSDTKYYVTVESKFEYGKEAGRLHCRLAKEIFGYLNTDSVRYYETVLGTKLAHLVWPETSLEDLEKVLAAMKSDFDVLNSKEKPIPKIDLTKFRFRVGDKVLVKRGLYKIVGYYFSNNFNDFENVYGYVIEGITGGVRETRFGYDEFGNHLAPSTKNDRIYISENRVNNSETVNKEQNIKKDGNEIKLQRPKAVISRGKVPEGCRIRCKIYKASISVQSLGYTKIAGGSEEPTS